MVTIWNIKKNTLSEDDLLQVELRGLSTDTKPTSLIGGIIDNGSVFIEIDTQDVYIYDGENELWEPAEETDNTEDTQENNNKSKIEEVEEKEIPEIIDSQER